MFDFFFKFNKNYCGYSNGTSSNKTIENIWEISDEQNFLTIENFYWVINYIDNTCHIIILNIVDLVDKNDNK